MKCLSMFFMSVIVSCASLASDGPIRLVANPTNLVLRLGEPAMFTFELSNRSDRPVEGIFVPLDRGFAGLSIEIIDPLGNRHWFAHNEVVDVMYNERILKPGEVLKSSMTILFDMVKKRHVFNRAGEYTISFILQWKWKELQRPVVKTTVRVEVLSWEKESLQSIYAAMELWMDRDIAYAFQTGAELSDSSLGRLRKLREDYADTVYGKLASDLLERARTPP